ncbi:MAG: VCBS repeat-containing protein, partial [Candidatus Rokuibacteriota bacterium]
MGSCTVTLTAATAVTATFAFSPVVPAKRGDFNGDGKADLLWRHAQSGEVQVWLMNGAAITASGSPFTVPDPNWKIVGVGDFDGDGKADLFWRRDGSGDTYVWFMNGLAIAGAAPSFALADTNWKVE